MSRAPSEDMSLPIDASQTMLAHPCSASLENERRSWLLHQRGLLLRYGRTVTLGIALRHIRTAPTHHTLLAMVKEILVHHVGVSAFAVLEATNDVPRVLAARGIAAGDATRTPLARIPLGMGACALGALVIYRLAPAKEALDAFNHELLAALGPQIAVALHATRLDATRPTIRPPRPPRTEEQ